MPHISFFIRYFMQFVEILRDIWILICRPLKLFLALFWVQILLIFTLLVLFIFSLLYLLFPFLDLLFPLFSLLLHYFLFLVIIIVCRKRLVVNIPMQWFTRLNCIEPRYKSQSWVILAIRIDLNLNGIRVDYRCLLPHEPTELTHLLQLLLHSYFICFLDVYYLSRVWVPSSQVHSLLLQFRCFLKNLMI